MRLKKSDFKRLITVICILLGIAVIVFAADLILMGYFSSKNAEYDVVLAESDKNGGFEALQASFNTLKGKIKDLGTAFEQMQEGIASAKQQTDETNALYDEALKTNEELRKTSSAEFSKLQEQYDEMDKKYESLLAQYNKLKEGN